MEVLDRFIDDGVLVSTGGRSGEQNWTYSAHEPGTWNVPLVLLTDSESASAAEIVAGAIRDHRRGVIVGRRSFGKCSVQSIFPIRRSMGLRLTTARFHSPHGHCWDKVGVRPDVHVPAPPKRTTFYRGTVNSEISNDSDVQKALEILRSQMSRR